VESLCHILDLHAVWLFNSFFTSFLKKTPFKTRKISAITLNLTKAQIVKELEQKMQKSCHFKTIFYNLY